MKGDGFRSDGSHFYSSLIKDPFKKDAEDEDATFSDTLKRIKNGENKFSFGDTVSDKALTEVDKLLNYCSLNNIKVVAFLPPFASKTYNAMINSGKHTYVLKIYSELAPIFSKYKDMELYDYSNIEWYGSSDLETVDGFHGSENSYGKLIMDIASKSKFLENYVNITLIKDKIENTKNPYYLFI
ncbi:MAG: hypothetical protein ACD_79C00549G0002 [uncultured bacterium]|nr:MAG: hypothetical protein ACD_79C00549G0002 [uncultured bacterium]